MRKQVQAVSRNRLTWVAIVGVVTLAAAEVIGQDSSFPRILLPTPSNASAPAASVRLYSQAGAFRVNAVAVDAQENVYIAGSANDAVQLIDFPAVYGRKPSNDGDAIVAKIDRTGRPIWASFFGGNDSRRTSRLGNPDVVLGLAVDAIGQVYAVGRTNSTDFPIVSGFQSSPAAPTGGTDGFLVKLSADGQRIVYSTYFGASDGSSGLTVVQVGPTGEVWAGGTSTARSLFTTHDLSGGVGNAFVILLKLSPSGGLLWSTRPPLSSVVGLGVSATGDVIAAGQCTQCPNSTSPADQPFGAAVVRLASTGSQMRSVTIVTSLSSFTNASIATDGRVYAIGQTADPMLAVRNAWQPRSGSGDVQFPSSDAFVAIINAAGGVETVSYLGGRAEELSPTIAAAANGEFAVNISTGSNDLAVARALVDHHVDGPVYRSFDRGLTWQVAGRLTLPATAAPDLSYDAGNEEVYATTVPLTHTRDMGTTWIAEPVTPFNPSPERVVFDPRQSSVRYAAIAGNIHRFDPIRGTWTMVLRSQPGANLRVIAVSPHDSSVWVAGNFGVEVSVDGGTTWTRRDEGLPQAPFIGVPANARLSPNVFAFHPTERSTVYAGGGFGVFVTTNLGVSWQPLVATGQPVPDVTAIAFDPLRPQLMHLATRNGGLLRCDDGGRQCVRKLADLSLTAVATDPMKRHIVYAAGLAPDGAPTFRLSVDHGETWPLTGANFDMRAVPSDLFVDPRDSSRIFASSALHSFVPYVARFRPTTPLGTYATDVATYLGSGGGGGIAITPSGDTVVALNQQWGDAFSSRAAIVRIAR